MPERFALGGFSRGRTIRGGEGKLASKGNIERKCGTKGDSSLMKLEYQIDVVYRIHTCPKETAPTPFVAIELSHSAFEITL